MIPYTVYDRHLSLVKRLGTAPDDQWQHQCSDDELIAMGHHPNTWWDGSQILPLPDRPALFYVWDLAQRAWIDGRTVDTLYAIHVDAIRTERDRRVFDPVIVYDGKRLDADERSVLNLGRRLTSLAYRTTNRPMPTQSMVWRDADNRLHWFTNLASYMDWLGGLAVALDDRRQAAYGWSWQKKADLESIRTDRDALIAFDPTS